MTIQFTNELFQQNTDLIFWLLQFIFLTKFQITFPTNNLMVIGISLINKFTHN